MHRGRPVTTSLAHLTMRRDAETPVAMSASRNCVFWKRPTGWPNCCRDAVYSAAWSTQNWAPPTLHAAMLMRPPSTARTHMHECRTHSRYSRYSFMANAPVATPFGLRSRS